MNTKIKNKNGVGKQLAYSLILAVIVLAGLVVPVNAVELNAVLSTTSTSAQPSFQFERTYVIDYPNGGNLENLLNGKNVTMTYHVDPSDPLKKALINSLNQEISQSLSSAASITDVDITYEAMLYSSNSETHVDYKITFIPTVSNYVLRKATNDSAAILDVQWMGVSINGTMMVNVPNYGSFDLNSPIDFIKMQSPDLYNKLQGTAAENLFDDPLMASNDLLLDPISQWQHLFDPAYTLVDTNILGYKGQKIVVSTYSTGESNISEGRMLPTVKDTDLTLDVDYPVSYTERASLASIQIDGYVAVTNINEIEYFGSSPQAPQGSGISSTGDYPVQVIYSMAGFGVVVAIGVFWWSSRVTKQEKARANEVVGPSGPIQYEERKHWADRFDQ
jgi:hypothetical protein